MKRIGKIRIEVSQILNEIFGDSIKGISFSPENIIKRSGSNSKRSKYDLSRTVSWYASSDNLGEASVDCIGMTMTDFLKEYEKQNIIITHSTNHSYNLYSIYIDKPILKTRGYVRKISRDNKYIDLFFSELSDEYNIPITPKTPKWLYQGNEVISFNCKLYLFWRGLKKDKVENSDWSSVWSTFKYKKSLSDFEIEYFDVL